MHSSSVSRVVRFVNHTNIQRITASHHFRYVHNAAVTKEDTIKPYNEIPRVTSNLVTIMDFARKKYSNAKFHEFLQNRVSEYGDIYVENIGYAGEKVYTANPDDWKILFNQDTKDQPAQRESLWAFAKYHRMRGLPRPLFDLDDAEWHRRKEALRSLLIPREVAKVVPKYVDITNDFLDFLEGNLTRNNTRVVEDYHRSLSRWTFECAGMTVFQERFGMLQEYGNIDETVKMFYEANLDLIDRWCLLETGSLHHRIMSTDLWKEFVKTSDDTFKAASIFLNKSKQHIVDPDASLDEVESLVLAVDVLRAGIDTVSNVAIWATIELSNNPHIQEKLYEELKTALGDSEITSSTLQKLPYLRACLKEVHRTRPLFPIQSRMTLRDVVLSGYHVPSGTNVAPLLGFYNKERYFKSHEEFQPERWLRSNEDKGKHHAYAVLPFGHGPRSCIGRRIAENQLLLYLAKLVLKYKIRPTKDYNTRYAFFVVPEGPVDMKFEKRN